MTKFMVVLHDVDNDEVELGPFGQVCFEVDVVGAAVRPVLRDAATSEAIAYNYAGFWYKDDRPFRQAFVRAVVQETSSV